MAAAAQQFVTALLAKSTFEFAQQNLDSFRQTVDISQKRFSAGDMSEGDLLKIKLQMFQFESDLATARLAKSQALIALRQQVGYESVPDNFDVEGELDYQPIKGNVEDLQALALRSRPDLQAAQQGVVAATRLVHHPVAGLVEFPLRLDPLEGDGPRRRRGDALERRR